ncbi:MAG: hypothetical protein DMG17_23220 [Acidobacteria bacterium]|nr:MAG: hypothetical protein DMG17_23220 [Acidobacteriota bacterium]
MRKDYITPTGWCGTCIIPCHEQPNLANPSSHGYFVRRNRGRRTSTPNYGFRTRAENQRFGQRRAAGQKSEAAGFGSGWMHSSGHRQNILNSAYRKTGIGAAVADDGQVYITQVFCG